MPDMDTLLNSFLQKYATFLRKSVVDIRQPVGFGVVYTKRITAYYSEELFWNY